MTFRPVLNVSAAALAVAALFASPLAHADIVFSSASITDHGSYITDTVGHLDWYKFSNPTNTLDISFDAAIAQFAPLGWGAASLAQVQGLESQFGWTADTPDTGFNVNYSLTGAMAELLGYTNQLFTFGIGFESFEVLQIRALTSEAFFSLPDFAGPFQQATLSEYFQTTDAHNQVFFTGDHVLGDDGSTLHSLAEVGTGTWLVRNSSTIGDGCVGVSAAACGIPPVPEPETWALTCLGLVGLFIRRRRSRD